MSHVFEQETLQSHLVFMHLASFTLWQDDITKLEGSVYHKRRGCGPVQFALYLKMAVNHFRGIHAKLGPKTDLWANEKTRTMSSNHFVSAYEDRRSFTSSVTQPRCRVNIHFINHRCQTTATAVTFQHSQSSSLLLLESTLHKHHTGIRFSPSISANALILGFKVGIEIGSAGEFILQ